MIGAPGRATVGPTLGAIAVALVVRAGDTALERPGSAAVLGATALVLALAWAPGASATPRAQVRRLVILAVLLGAAGLAPLSDVARTFSPLVALEHAARLLALTGAGLELGAFLHERRAALRERPTLSHESETPPAEPRARRRAGALFAAAALTLFTLAVPYRLLSRERHVDLARLDSRPFGERARLATWPLLSPVTIPETARVLEDGRPLPLDNVRPEAVAALGSGRYAVVSPRGVVWSSTDASDPATNGRRYELVFQPETTRSELATAVFALAGLALLVAWRHGAVDLLSPSPTRERALATAALGLALAASLPGRWDQLAIARDSEGYVQHSLVRPPLYPWFLDLADPRPREPRPALVPDSDHAHLDPASRFVGAVRLQKIMASLAVVGLFWVLAATWNAWLLAAVAWVVFARDAATFADGSASFCLGSLLSEGLAIPLGLALAAATLASLRRPRLGCEAAAALLVGLLVLVRPSSAALGVALAWLVLGRAVAGEGRRRLALRAVGLAALVALPLLLGAAHVAARTGRFRIDAGTGMHLFGTAFEVATPEDETALLEDDAAARRFLHACLVEHARDRAAIEETLAPAPGRARNFVDQNIYAIGVPEIDRALALGPEQERERPWLEDALFARVARALVRRHPLAFARQALRELGVAFDPWLHVPIALAGAVACWRWRRERNATLEWLFLATLPLIAILPSCVFNFPLVRYRAPFTWAELAALPLFLALVLRAPEETAP